MARSTETVYLLMGCVDVIWQDDAGAMAVRALADAVSLPLVLNVVGQEQLRVREVCGRFGQTLTKPEFFRGDEETDAFSSEGLLSFDH